MSFFKAFYFCFYGNITYRSECGVKRFSDGFNVCKRFKIIATSFSCCDLSEMSKKKVHKNISKKRKVEKNLKS